MSELGDIDALDEAIKKLRVAYDKYFLGLERREPADERAKVKNWLQRARAEHTPNTARRFRLNQLQASLVTYEAYWDRLCRQIEEGTFKRDLLRAQRQQSAAPPPSSPSNGATTPRHYPEHLMQLHSAYRAAQAQVGAKEVSLEALARTVEKQTATIKERYKCQAVDFKVAIKDGKAILKAIPR